MLNMLSALNIEELWTESGLKRNQKRDASPACACSTARIQECCVCSDGQYLPSTKEKEKGKEGLGDRG